MKADISKVVPKRSFFQLKVFGDEKLYLAPASAKKLLEIENKYGGIETILSVPSAENLSKTALSLMEISSAKKFIKQKIECFDVETGEVNEKYIGGYELLMESISGFNEQFGILRAIMESLGFKQSEAQLVIDEITKKINGKVDHIEKKSQEKTK